MGEVENCLVMLGPPLRKTGWKLNRVIGAGVVVVSVRRIGDAIAGRWMIVRRARRASGENNWDILCCGVFLFLQCRDRIDLLNGGGHVICGFGNCGLPEELDALLLCLEHHRHLHVPFFLNLTFYLSYKLCKEQEPSHLPFRNLNLKINPPHPSSWYVIKLRTLYLSQTSTRTIKPSALNPISNNPAQQSTPNPN